MLSGMRSNAQADAFRETGLSYLTTRDRVRPACFVGVPVCQFPQSPHQTLILTGGPQGGKFGMPHFDRWLE